MTEQWRPVVDIDGYEVSSLGRVRSLDRVVQTRQGPKRFRGQELTWSTSSVNPYRFARLGTARRTVYAHHLVAAAFLGPRPDGAMILHGPAGPGCDAATNLRYGTQADNMRDKRRDGTDPYVARTHCPRRHPLVEPNLRGADARKGRRSCLACARTTSKAGYLRRKYDRHLTNEEFLEMANEYFESIMGGAS